MRRRIVPITVAAAVSAASLVGCSAQTVSTGACDVPLAPGVLSESVTVDGLETGVPDVSIDGEARILTPQRTLVEAADDRSTVAKDGSIVAANIAYFDSVTGDLLEASPGFGSGTGSELFLVAAEGGPVLQGILCAAPGDVIAIALPADQSVGAVSSPDASLVVVAEIAGVYEAAAKGVERALPAGFPSVATDESGRVGIVLPPQDAPTSTVRAVRIEGAGQKVTPENIVIANVLTVAWNGEMLKNTWDSGPESLDTAEGAASTGATLRAELNGIPVGSQVVVIEPGEGNPRVSVIDVLAVA